MTAQDDSIGEVGGARTRDAAQMLLVRAAFFDRVRTFFRDRDFVEVDSPLLVRSVPTEAHVVPFPVTIHCGRGGHGEERRYLPTSPEGALKRQLAALGRNLFEIGHAFRDGEEEGGRHRAHFRLLEWYRCEADYRDVLGDTQQLLADVARFFATDAVARNALPAPPPALLAAETRILSVPDAFERYLGHPIAGPDDLESLVGLAHERGHHGVRTWVDAFHVLLAIDVEPHLGRDRPVFLTDYPSGIAAQARAHPDRPWLAEQFELFVDGVELANCYSEVTDPAEQEARFEREAADAASEGRTPPAPDPELLAALARLPARTAGGSVGLERLLMLWLGAETLGDVRPTW